MNIVTPENANTEPYVDLGTPLQVFEFTDPTCTWCWGSEPVMRALEWRFGDLIDTDYIVGGLMKNVNDFTSGPTKIADSVDEINQMLAQQWLHASNEHRMPFNQDDFILYDEHNNSSYPLCIAYKSAQYQSRQDAKCFLRKLREAIAFEGLQATRTDVMLKLAEECKLDIGMLLSDLKGKDGLRGFADDMDARQAYGIQGLPSYLIRIDEKELILQSFQTYDTLVKAIEEVSEGKYTDKTVSANKDTVYEFLQRYKSVADIEVATAFDTLYSTAMRLLNELIADGVAVESKKGNGRLVRLK